MPQAVLSFFIRNHQQSCALSRQMWARWSRKHTLNTQSMQQSAIVKGVLKRTVGGKTMTSYNEWDGLEKVCVCAGSKERTRVDYSLPSGPHRCLLHTLIISHLSLQMPLLGKLATIWLEERNHNLVAHFHHQNCQHSFYSQRCLPSPTR